MECQKEYMQNQQKVKQYDGQLQQCKRNKEKFSITVREIEKLDTEHNTYRSIGRAFFLTPKQEISEEYTKMAV